MRKSVRIIVPATILIILIGVVLAYHFNYIPHQKYTSSDFGIEQYVSTVDMDSDGIDDQRDILMGARDYLKTKPKYKSKYYSEGYPDDNYGVCTDVVANGLLEAGYDLQILMDRDIQENPERYDIASPDKNIDFRRVVNQNAYLAAHAISLTIDTNEIGE